LVVPAHESGVSPARYSLFINGQPIPGQQISSQVCIFQLGRSLLRLQSEILPGWGSCIRGSLRNGRGPFGQPGFQSPSELHRQRKVVARGYQAPGRGTLAQSWSSVRRGFPLERHSSQLDKMKCSQLVTCHDFGARRNDFSSFSDKIKRCDARVNLTKCETRWNEFIFFLFFFFSSECSKWQLR